MKLYYPIIATTYTNILYAVVKQYAIGAVNVWHVVRGLDQFSSRGDRGKGWVTFNLKHLASDCGIKADTLKKWIREAHKAGLVIDYKWLPEGRAWVRYTSITKVCRQYEVLKLGAVIELSPVQITQVKYHCTRAELLAQQGRSRFAATHEEKVDDRKSGGRRRFKKKNLNDYAPKDLLRLRACDLRDKGIEGVKAVSNGRIYVDETFATYGASQLEMAKKLGITARTVSNHIKERSLTQRWKSYLEDIHKAAEPFSDDTEICDAVRAIDEDVRDRRYLNRLNRVHICQTDSKAQTLYSYYQSRHFCEEERVNTHYFRYKDLYYKSLCCIFEKEYNLLSKKSLRRRVSCFVARSFEDALKNEQGTPLTRN